MLPLKFKAIDKTTGQEYAMCDVAIRRDLQVSFSPEGLMQSSNPDLVFSQYTGKNDKHGKEIYTLDILAVGPWHCVISDTFRQQKIACLIECVYGEFICNFYDSNMEYSVVGNRYESLDSLESRKHNR